MLLPLLLVPCAWAQGLRPSTDSTLGAAASVESLSNLLAQAQSFRALFKDSPKVACSQGKQSVCGSGASQDAYATLYLAMSAQAYDARSQGVSARHAGAIAGHAASPSQLLITVSRNGWHGVGGVLLICVDSCF
jgi:hypothetical protein